jgi:hypothetical protein
MATSIKIEMKIFFEIFMQSLILYFLKWIRGGGRRIWNVKIIEELSMKMFSPVFQIRIHIDLTRLGMDSYWECGSGSKRKEINK